MLKHKRSFVKKITTEILETLEWVIVILPNTYFGNKLRLWFWKRRLKNPYIKFVGRNAQITMTVAMDLGRAFILGEFAALAIGDSDPIYIGNDVGMGRGAYLRSANHRFDDLAIDISAQGHTSKKIEFQGKVYSIVIEDDVWIGANAIILTGAHIGKGAVVSAASVVSSIIPPYSIVVGNPARVIANRLKLAKLHAESREG
jgi:acetyltransferase-like isoleucine patch superfamily enzyme